MSFEPESLLDQFLTALSDAGAGETLHRLHAPDALLQGPDGLRRAADTLPADFAALHREINLCSAQVLPHFQRPSLIRRSDDPSRAEIVCWFEVTETRSQQGLLIAAGIH